MPVKAHHERSAADCQPATRRYGQLSAFIALSLSAVVIGDRTDFVGLNHQNQDAVWEVWSDKYIGNSRLEYQVTTTVTGPELNYPPVKIQGDPATVDLPPGRFKDKILKVKIFDPATDRQKAVIKDYIARSPK